MRFDGNGVVVTQSMQRQAEAGRRSQSLGRMESRVASVQRDSVVSMETVGDFPCLFPPFLTDYRSRIVKSQPWYFWRLLHLRQVSALARPSCLLFHLRIQVRHRRDLDGARDIISDDLAKLIKH